MDHTVRIIRYGYIIYHILYHYGCFGQAWHGYVDPLRKAVAGQLCRFPTTITRHQAQGRKEEGTLGNRKPRRATLKKVIRQE